MPGLLGMPWELICDPAGPVALDLAGVSRNVPVADLAATTRVPGGRLRVLISSPEGRGWGVPDDRPAVATAVTALPVGAAPRWKLY